MTPTLGKRSNHPKGSQGLACGWDSAFPRTGKTWGEIMPDCRVFPSERLASWHRWHISSISLSYSVILTCCYWHVWGGTCMFRNPLRNPAAMILLSCICVRNMSYKSFYSQTDYRVFESYWIRFRWRLDLLWSRGIFRIYIHMYFYVYIYNLISFLETVRFRFGW